MAKRVVLITGHYFNSKRKAGYHWLADAYQRLGWEVLFFTAPISWLSVLKRDYRLEYPVLNEAGKMNQVDKNVYSFIWFTRWHPANLRLPFLNRLSHNYFKKYDLFALGEAENFIKKADLFIFESSPALLLVNRFRQLNPKARLVYRISDDLRLLNNHPVVLDSEKENRDHFDLISTPSKYIGQKFEGHKKLKLQLHGIRKSLFRENYPNPYSKDDNINLVFVGQTQFDYDFLQRASYLFPEFRFHIIGPIPKLPHRDNIISYGEKPFIETVPYLKYADIGLHTLSYSPGAESFSDSLKLIQYRFCRLPVVAPEFLRTGRLQMFYYRPGNNQSIKASLEAASQCDRGTINDSDIYSWDELALQLAEDK